MSVRLTTNAAALLRRIGASDCIDLGVFDLVVARPLVDAGLITAEQQRAEITNAGRIWLMANPAPATSDPSPLRRLIRALHDMTDAELAVSGDYLEAELARRAELRAKRVKGGK